MSDQINHPDHYTQGPIECIQVLEQLNLDFRLSNCIKYIWRHRTKGGIEDLRKARWYLDRYLAGYEPGQIDGVPVFKADSGTWPPQGITTYTQR